MKDFNDRSPVGYKAIQWLALTMFAFFAVNLNAQISHGGTPPSFTDSSIEAVRFDVRSFDKPDMQVIEQEDWENSQSPYPEPERMGVSVFTYLNMENSGTWTPLHDGGRIWRLSIHVADALALGVYYDHFYLPEGGQLYLYNESKTQVLGAYTHENNPESDLFATEFVQGDLVTLEYYEAPGTNEAAEISISEVAYAYRFISFNYDGLSRDQSWPCMINVKCEEGIGWEDQIRGIARMSIKIGAYYYWCSGSLINNTSHNRVPYFLSAEHCSEGASAADRNQWIFYFNYQASTCAATWGPTSNTVTGCTFKAKDPLASYPGADFDLMQLNSTPPLSYNVYYNGWNRENVGGASGVGIHHPAGDIKKISTFATPMISSTWWNGTPTHWKITWSATVNGLSIMQGGSSGSPIFDQDGHIMGDLSGGYESNACATPSPAWYGKFYYAWDQNGSTSSQRLKDWLDPTNTGDIKIPGLNATIMPPLVDFEADTTEITQGDTVRFTDLTTGNPALSWTWIMPGAEPDTSYDQNPVVVYSAAGTFDVTLTVVNADGTSSEEKTGYITVAEVTLPDADFMADKVEITVGESVNFTDLSTNNPNGWIWIFQNGTPGTAYVQNPENITYNTAGEFNVVMTASNFAGSNTEVKVDYIKVNPGQAPVADFSADVTEINEGDAVNFSDLSTNSPNEWLWTFEGGNPPTSTEQNPSGIVYSAQGTYNVTLQATNAVGSNTLVKEDYIVVGPVSIQERNASRQLLVYPNPTSGAVNVRLLQTNAASPEVTVYNSIGEEISRGRMNDHGRISFDLTGQPEGLYIIKVKAGDRIFGTRLSVIGR